MKKLLLASVALIAVAGTASAADLAARPYTKAPAAPMAAVYDWTGFYVGGHVGGGWATLNSTELTGSAAFPIGTAFTRNNPSGVLGGVQGGFNWQVSNYLVLGVEGEYAWADVNGTATTLSIVNGFRSTTNAKLNNIAMVTGRVGYAMNNVLLYVKGGGAWGDGNSTGTVVNGAGALFATTSSSSDRSGYVVGGGVEWGFAPNWSAKLEYNYVDFGARTVAVASSLGTTSFVRSSEKMDIFKAGVNYRFNWGGPAVPRY